MISRMNKGRNPLGELVGN